MGACRRNRRRHCRRCIASHCTYECLGRWPNSKFFWPWIFSFKPLFIFSLWTIESIDTPFEHIGESRHDWSPGTVHWIETKLHFFFFFFRHPIYLCIDRSTHIPTSRMWWCADWLRFQFVIDHFHECKINRICSLSLSIPKMKMTWT